MRFQTQAPFEIRITRESIPVDFHRPSHFTPRGTQPREVKNRERGIGSPAGNVDRRPQSLRSRRRCERGGANCFDISKITEGRREAVKYRRRQTGQGGT